MELGKWPRMATIISRSPEDTFALGVTWGQEAEPGLVIALSGDLGAGKTQLVKGVACGLGIDTRVHSPTFALVNEYSGGRLPLHHLDLYRLETPAQIAAAGLEECLAGTDGVVVVEWAERWFGDPGHPLNPAPARFRRVDFRILSAEQRLIQYEAPGT